MYIWQRADWPRFRQDQARLTGPLAAARHAQGRLLGRMEALGFDLRSEATLSTLTENVVKTSARRLRAASDWMPAACRPRTAMSTASWI